MAVSQSMVILPVSLTFFQRAGRLLQESGNCSGVSVTACRQNGSATLNDRMIALPSNDHR
jgi:hypothetical protein